MQTLYFKDSIKLGDRATISLWLGDSQVWADTAVMLDKRGRTGSGAIAPNANHNELNVAHVCMGLAFELALKALAVSEGRQSSNKHRAGVNYRNLSQPSQDKVAHAINLHTGMTIKGYLEYLDERMCHPDRKYWMVDKSGTAGGTGFASIPALSIPAAARIHSDIADLVGHNTYRNWQRGVPGRRALSTGRSPSTAPIADQAVTLSEAKRSLITAGRHRHQS